MHKSIRACVALLGLGTLAAGCGVTHLARPVGRHNTRINLSSGGPIVTLGGAPIPIPLTSVGVAYGLENNVDLHADLHPFAAVFSPGDGSSPILGMDVGAAWHPIPHHLNNLTIGGIVYGFTDKLDAVLFVDAWIAADARLLSWLSIAGGFHNLFRIATTDNQLDERPVWAPTAFGQLAFRPGNGRVELELEARWYAFTQNGYRATPVYSPIGQLGALGVILGVSYQFPRGWQ